MSTPNVMVNLVRPLTKHTFRLMPFTTNATVDVSDHCVEQPPVLAHNGLGQAFGGEHALSSPQRGPMAGPPGPQPMMMWQGHPAQRWPGSGFPDLSTNAQAPWHANSSQNQAPWHAHSSQNQVAQQEAQVCFPVGFLVYPVLFAAPQIQEAVAATAQQASSRGPAAPAQAQAQEKKDAAAASAAPAAEPAAPEGARRKKTAAAGKEERTAARSGEAAAPAEAPAQVARKEADAQLGQAEAAEGKSGGTRRRTRHRDRHRAAEASADEPAARPEPTAPAQAGAQAQADRPKAAASGQVPAWAVSAAQQLGISTQEASTSAESGSNSPTTSEVSAPAIRIVELSRPSQYWPDTPESTPPCTPRWQAGSFPSDFFGGGSFQTGAEQTQGEPDFQVAGEDFYAAQGEEPVQVETQAEAEVCEQLLRGLEDPSERDHVLQIVSGMAWQMASSPSGCRVVQRALEVGSSEQRAALAESLRGRVREALASPHANHVLQKCIEVLANENVQFVLEEIKGHAEAAARHRFGCRVLERLLEHCHTEQTATIVEEVLQGSPQLCRHTFGNFVVQHVLEHGTPEQRRVIAEVIRSDIQRLSRHRVASHVVRCALKHCPVEDTARLVQTMRSDPAELADLAHHHCGSFVVREMRRADLRK